MPGFRGRLTDLLFVGRLEHLAHACVAFVKHLRKEVAIPVFVEDQFALGRRGIGLRVLDLEESGGRAVDAADLHDCQIRVVEHVDDVRAGRKFGVPCMELEGDRDFKVSDDLRMSFGRVNSHCKNQSDEERQQVMPPRRFSACSAFVDCFRGHTDFSSFLSQRKASAPRATHLEGATRLPKILLCNRLKTESTAQQWQNLECQSAGHDVQPRQAEQDVV